MIRVVETERFNVLGNGLVVYSEKSLGMLKMKTPRSILAYVWLDEKTLPCGAIALVMLAHWYWLEFDFTRLIQTRSICNECLRATLGQSIRT